MLNNYKICILKINDDNFLILDELRHELKQESIILLYTKNKCVTNEKVINVIKNERIKILVLPEFINNTNELYNLFIKDMIVLTYNDILEKNKRILFITDCNLNTYNKSLLIEKTNKLNYDFLYKIKQKYKNIDYIVSTIYISGSHRTSPIDKCP